MCISACLGRCENNTIILNFKTNTEIKKNWGLFNQKSSNYLNKSSTLSVNLTYGI